MRSLSRFGMDLTVTFDLVMLIRSSRVIQRVPYLPYLLSSYRYVVTGIAQSSTADSAVSLQCGTASVF